MLVSILDFVLLCLCVARIVRATDSRHSQVDEKERKAKDKHYRDSHKEAIKANRNRVSANRTEKQKEVQRAKDCRRQAKCRHLRKQKFENAVEVTPYGTTVDVEVVQKHHERLVRDAEASRNYVERQKATNPIFLPGRVLRAQLQPLAKAHGEYKYSPAVPEALKADVVDKVHLKTNASKVELTTLAHKTFDTLMKLEAKKEAASSKMII